MAQRALGAADFRALTKCFRQLERLIERILDLLDGGGTAVTPPEPGRVRTARFERELDKTARAELDGIVLDGAQTDILLLLALAEGRGESLSAEALAGAIGAYRGDGGPPPKAIESYVSRVRGRLRRVRTDGPRLVKGNERVGWRMAIDEHAHVSAPDWGVGGGPKALEVLGGPAVAGGRTGPAYIEAKGRAATSTSTGSPAPVASSRVPGAT